jgi:hypothetical protein
LTCDGRLPLDEQLARFEQTLRRNRTLTEILARATTLDLPGWYLVAGCLYQTVWNVVSGQPPEAGILDYDLAYFDATDLSWAAEDAVIQAGHRVFGDLPAPVQIRNQARVHLWYEEKFGAPMPAAPVHRGGHRYYEATTACLGVRAEPGGRWRVYAPHGLSDVFNLVVRPNPVLAPPGVYQAKTERWRRQWPALTVLPWPAPANHVSPLVALPGSLLAHLGVVLGQMALHPVDVGSGRLAPPRAPCMTWPAAITPRGTALIFPSITSAMSSL